jgi:hypothetical protein
VLPWDVYLKEATQQARQYRSPAVDTFSFHAKVLLCGGRALGIGEVVYGSWFWSFFISEWATPVTDYPFPLFYLGAVDLFSDAASMSTCSFSKYPAEI